MHMKLRRDVQGENMKGSMEEKGKKKHRTWSEKSLISRRGKMYSSIVYAC